MKTSMRWKNKALWAAVAALVLLLLQTCGVPVVPEKFNAIVSALLGILVMAGILVDPTTPGLRDEGGVARQSDVKVGGSE